MTGYERPAIDAPVIRDDDGTVIDYGHRWTGSPPEDTYSIDTHPERFAPLHTVADALVAHLIDTYDVHAVEGAHLTADLVHPIDAPVRAVRLTPTDPACAPLTLAWTAYPGVVVHAGVLHDFLFPICGCDACDEPWDRVADEMEQTVLAIVGGGYREQVGRSPRRWITHGLELADGSSSSGSLASSLPADRVRAARRVLRTLDDGRWAAWPERPAPPASVSTR